MSEQYKTDCYIAKPCETVEVVGVGGIWEWGMVHQPMGTWHINYMSQITLGPVSVVVLIDASGFAEQWSREVFSL